MREDNDDNNNDRGRSGGWGKLTVMMLAGMLLVSTLIIGITVPLSGRGEAIPTTTPSSTALDADAKEEVGSAAITEIDAKDDFELYGRAANNDAAVKEITLVAQDAELEIAPGKVVKAWTFNGTMPGPALRFAEGDNLRIKFINKTPIPHTLHLHGNHDDANDGVLPQVMPNESYVYNITAGPAGALMYHCHAHPTSLHIRMGMYGAMIIDPKEPLKPAREYVMVMGEYDTKDPLKFEAEYYPINGYADQYMKNPIEARSGELVRMYVINIGTTIPYQFHLHSTIFKAYPSGLLSNAPIDAQTIPVGPGDATIVEARWKYDGDYLFHSHGMQEERGNMGQIHVVDGSIGKGNETSLAAGLGLANGTTATTIAPVAEKSVSMFDWQYELQKKLQKPEAVQYAEGEQGAGSHQSSGETSHDKAQAENSNSTAASSNGAAGQATVAIANGASNPNSKVSYEPATVTVKSGSTISWVNNDSMMHTATSGNPESGPSGIFDTGIIGSSGKTAETNIDAEPGSYDYYCALHPYMKGQMVVVAE